MTGKRPWQSRTAMSNGAISLGSAVVAGGSVLLGAPGSVTGWALLVALYTGLQVWLRLTTSRPIIIRGPVTVAHVGGIEFDGAATVTGALAGHDIDHLKES